MTYNTLDNKTVGIIKLSKAPYSQELSAYIPPSMWATKFDTHIKRRNYNSVCLNRYINSVTNIELIISGTTDKTNHKLDKQEYDTSCMLKTWTLSSPATFVVTCHIPQGRNNTTQILIKTCCISLNTRHSQHVLFDMFLPPRYENHSSALCHCCTDCFIAASLKLRHRSTALNVETA
jgi:hypothetical protein